MEVWEQDIFGEIVTVRMRDGKEVTGSYEGVDQIAEKSRTYIKVRVAEHRVILVPEGFVERIIVVEEQVTPREDGQRSREPGESAD